jgi:hypothetical protein
MSISFATSCALRLWLDAASRSNNQEEIMAVRLRIAGLYYDEKFEFSDLTPIPAFVIPDRIPPVPNPPVPPANRKTIFELLEAAYRKPGKNKENFIYVFERRGPTLSLTSLGVTHKKNIVATLGNQSRPAGTYQLTEIAIPSGVVAWQYYVYRNGISTSQLKPPPVGPTGFSPAKGDGTGFTGFDQFVLKDGDEVIWRQVAILRGPNVPVH